MTRVPQNYKLCYHSGRYDAFRGAENRYETENINTYDNTLKPSAKGLLLFDCGGMDFGDGVVILFA